MKENARRRDRKRGKRRHERTALHSNRSAHGYGSKPAGRLATLIMAVAGIVIGASGAIFTGNGGQAQAVDGHVVSLGLREAPELGSATLWSRRDAIVERIMSAGAPHRFKFHNPNTVSAQDGVRPKIIIVFDDMGLDKAAFEKAVGLPGPLTFSFLPYASDVQPLADRARARGDAVMLHLPMEPASAADPGPHSLTHDMSEERLLREIDWNLERFSGYVAVNNHMGSKLTRDKEKMKTVLKAMKRDGLFFVDSLTTGGSKLREAGEAVGVPVFTRDVFLDPEAGKETIRRQLALVETIAEETGYALAICHPRKDTLEVLGPWLTSAPARGFALATVTDLLEIERDRLNQSQSPGGS